MSGRWNSQRADGNCRMHNGHQMSAGGRAAMHHGNGNLYNDHRTNITYQRDDGWQRATTERMGEFRFRHQQSEQSIRQHTNAHRRHEVEEQRLRNELARQRWELQQERMRYNNMKRRAEQESMRQHEANRREQQQRVRQEAINRNLQARNVQQQRQVDWEQRVLSQQRSQLNQFMQFERNVEHSMALARRQ